MKAVVINSYGDTDVLKNEEFPMPTCRENEILVEVKACAMNPADAKIRRGELESVFPVSFPHILGGDIAGVVKNVGSKVKRFKAGDKVFCCMDLHKPGGYAEYCAVHEDYAALMPRSLSYTEAASLPVIGLTSIGALRDFAHLKKDQKVLIHAGAGGVGHFAIQYAKYLGAEVFATASKKNHEFLKSLGADVVIDYNKQDFVEVCLSRGGMDCVFELLGHSSYLKSLEACKRGGAVPCIVHPPGEKEKKLAKEKNIKTDFFLLKSTKQDMQLIADLVERKKVHPYVSKVLTMDHIKEAHKLISSGKTKGKIVMDIEHSWGHRAN